MATIDELAHQGELKRVRVRLSRNEFDDRRIYVVPSLYDWMFQTVPTMKPGRLKASALPSEQLLVWLREWIIGRPMRYGTQFKDLMPQSEEVWEAKTTDLRIFGWIYRPRVFVGVVGGYADDYKTKRGVKGSRGDHYDQAKKEVVSCRDRLPLDLPKLTGGKFDDLV